LGSISRRDIGCSGRFRTSGSRINSTREPSTTVSRWFHKIQHLRPAEPPIKDLRGQTKPRRTTEKFPGLGDAGLSDKAGAALGLSLVRFFFRRPFRQKTIGIISFLPGRIVRIPYIR